VEGNRRDFDKMSDKNFENLMNEIRKKIESDEKKIYSQKVINEYKNPTNFGIIKNPDAKAEIKGPCGDTMKITLKLKDELITDARFWTDGCGPSISCGNMLTKMIKDKKVEEALAFKKNELIIALDGLPKENLHCAKLATDTLHKALKKS